MIFLDKKILDQEDAQQAKGAVKKPENGCENGNDGADTAAVIPDVLERAARVWQSFHPTADMLDATAATALLDHATGAAEEDFLDVFEAGIDDLKDEDAVLACLCAATHFKAIGEAMASLHCLGLAASYTPMGASWLRVLVAAAYAEAGQEYSAIRAIAGDALAAGVLDEDARNALEAVLLNFGSKSGKDHGHALLIHALSTSAPPAIQRKRTMVEIGTTREIVQGQGSTQKLAELCEAQGIAFITVDMDPRNTRNAQRMFAREGYDFQAVTAKGEEFLAEFDGVIDYLFLDAYDFDHGEHSEIRQARYEKYLGARILEAQCHKMHLECAEAVLTKMDPDGLICFDDTWTDADGQWLAKGTTAMPFLLENGFALLEACNNAALLKPPQR